MRSLAIGVLGMDPGLVDQLDPKVLVGAINARRAWEEYYHRRPVYEAARITGWMSLQPYVKKGSQDRPADIYPLLWDKAIETTEREKPKPISAAEAEAMFARFDKLT